jgi:hypothetical protein
VIPILINFPSDLGERGIQPACGSLLVQKQLLLPENIHFETFMVGLNIYYCESQCVEVTWQRKERSLAFSK